jgi:rhodanese-related sulfurtransferase
MKELKNTRRLTIAAILFVLLIIFGLLTFRKPEFNYKISNQQMLEELYNLDNEVLPDDVMDIIAYGDSATVLIDIRNPYEYEKGFLGDAINIPVSDIMSEASIAFFDEMLSDSLSVIIYGNNQFEANGTFMMLHQLGYNNIKILLGGYTYITNEDIDYYNMPEIPEYFVEEPAFIFSEIIANIGSGANLENNTETVQTIQPVKRKKKAVAEGGC